MIGRQLLDLVAAVRSPSPAAPEQSTMAKVFKSFVDDTASKSADQDAKAAAAKAADQAFLDAQAATGGAQSAELAALQAIGGRCAIVGPDGSITRYFTDKASPTGFSVEVLPDGATATVPDPAPAPAPAPQPDPAAPPANPGQ